MVLHPLNMLWLFFKILLMLFESPVWHSYTNTSITLVNSSACQCSFLLDTVDHFILMSPVPFYLGFPPQVLSSLWCALPVTPYPPEECHNILAFYGALFYQWFCHLGSYSFGVSLQPKSINESSYQSTYFQFFINYYTQFYTHNFGLKR